MAQFYKIKGFMDEDKWMSFGNVSQTSSDSIDSRAQSLIM